MITYCMTTKSLDLTLTEKLGNSFTELPRRQERPEPIPGLSTGQTARPIPHTSQQSATTQETLGTHTRTGAPSERGPWRNDF